MMELRQVFCMKLVLGEFRLLRPASEMYKVQGIYRHASQRRRVGETGVFITIRSCYNYKPTVPMSIDLKH